MKSRKILITAMLTLLWIQTWSAVPVRAGESPLVQVMNAIHNNDLSRLTALLNLHREIINQGDESKKNTPLHLAAFRKNSEAVKILLARGANPDQPNSDGNTSLHYGAWWGDGDSMGLMIRAGAGVNARNNLGETPLHLSVMSGEPEKIKMLLYAGADKNIADNRGQTPLELARKRNHQILVKLLQGK